MAKVDIESAYRMVPVHPSDRHLLGMEWKGNIYVDTALPFGLRSAPKIFNSVADAIEWILKARGVTNVSHYLDDFIFIGAAGTSECQRNLQLVLEACAALGVPLAMHKVEGPEYMPDISRHTPRHGQYGTKVTRWEAESSKCLNQVMAG